MGRRRRPGRTTVHGMILNVLILLGCSTEPEASPEWSITTETLPGGGTRVVNTPPVEGEEPTWWIEEEVRIGTFDTPGPESFGQIRGIAVTDEGRIAVLETQSQELRVFAADGTHESTFGGKGGGPGEFEGAYGLMLGPDGLLYVPETRNARMSVLHPTDGFVRSHPMQLVQFRFIWSGIMDADGNILKPSTNLEERRGVIRVYDREMDELGQRPLPEPPEIDQEDPPSSFAYSRPGGGGGFVSVPFFPRMIQLLDPRGDIWSTEYADPTYRVFRWTPGGDTTLVIENPRPRVPVTQVERDSVVESIRTLIEGNGGSVPRDWSKIPDLKPGIETAFLSQEGRLWASRPSEDGLGHYDVYDRDGQRLGGAATDMSVWRFLAPVVKGDQFWAVVVGEFDVPYVVRGRVVPFECRSGNPAIAEQESTCLNTTEVGG